MDKRLCWYQNKNGSIWTCNLTNDLMVELETIIALAIMIYNVEKNSYKLHPMDEQYSMIPSIINEYVLLRIF